jgi:hypothetical protein
MDNGLVARVRLSWKTNMRGWGCIPIKTIKNSWWWYHLSEKIASRSEILLLISLFKFSGDCNNKIKMNNLWMAMLGNDIITMEPIGKKSSPVNKIFWLPARGLVGICILKKVFSSIFYCWYFIFPTKKIELTNFLVAHDSFCFIFVSHYLYISSHPCEINKVLSCGTHLPPILSQIARWSESDWSKN